jgi:Fungal specific transcription factor domain
LNLMDERLKCDRQSPCSNCTKRGQGSTCYFSHPRGGRIDKGNGADVQSRVKHLESLVLGLMNAQRGEPLQTPSDSLGAGSQQGSDFDHDMSNDNDQQEQTLQALGKLDVSGSNTQYVGHEHWASILDDIAEVKKHLEEEPESPDDEADQDDTPDDGAPELLTGAGRMPSKEQLLEEFPPQAEVDRLISAYFASPDPLCILMHGPSFQADYERFWKDKTAAPMGWLGLLYGIMSLAVYFELVQLEMRSEEAQELSELAAAYRRSAAQCLMASNYTKPVKWTLEGLMVYNMSEYARAREPQMGLWVILSMTVRVAMRMGYHRDAKHFPQISPFNGEMRRRAWGLLSQLDLLSSVQFGLPRNMRMDQCDTEIPGNYLDEDLTEDMKALPPPRPDSQYTPMSYSCLKGRLMAIFGRVVDEIVSTNATSYESILRMDAELTQVYDTMPATLRVRRTENSITDPACLVFRRYTLDILFHKSRCILHRNYIVPAQSNERYAFSLNCAMSSAKAILEHQVAMHEETKPGGRLRRSRWLLSGLTTEDFTLAAMVICLSVDSLMHASVPIDYQFFSGNEREFISLIESSHRIWQEWCQQPELACEKSRKASQVLGIMLRKIHSMYAKCPFPSEPKLEQPAPPPQPEFQPAASAPVVSLDPPAAVRTDVAPYQLTPDSTAAAYFPELPITDWIEAPQDINWDEWDDFFQPQAEAMEIPLNGWDGSLTGGVS